MQSITIKYTPTKINFKSHRQEGLTFNDFKEYNKTTKVTSKLKEIISDPKNYIGEGKSNAVYKLPNTDKFLLKIYKGITPENIAFYDEKLMKTPDLFTDINIGQPIARMGKYVLFIIKQAGEQHSIAYTNKNNLTTQDIKKYLADIKKVAHFPQKAYCNFTREIKELTKKNYYIDYFNSNNLLTTNSEINIVDTIQIKKAKQKITMFPSKESIMKIILDENILPQVLPQINNKEKQELCQNIKAITQKIETAMNQSKLPKNKLKTTIINFLLDTFHHKNNYKFSKALKSCLSFK